MKEELKIIITAELKQMQQAFNKARNEVETFRQKTGSADTALGRLQTATQRAGTHVNNLRHDYSNLSAEQEKNIRTSNKLGAETKDMGSVSKSVQDIVNDFSSTLFDEADDLRKASEELKKKGNALESLKANIVAAQMELKAYKELVAEETLTTGNAKEATEAWQEEIKGIQKELKKNTKELEKAEKAGEDAAKTFKEKLGGGMQKASEMSKKALATMGKAIVGLVASMIALNATTKEYRTNQAKLVTSFEMSGASAETAKETFNDLYRVLGDAGQATEAAQHLAKLTSNTKDLEQWTTITQGVYATFGDSLPIESLTEAANETAKTGELTGALADALNWAGINEDDFTASLLECNNEAEREALIRSTLLGIYGEAAEQYEKNAAGVLAQNEAELALKDSLAQIGEAVTPIVTAFARMASVIAEKVAPAIESFVDENSEEITNALLDLAEAIGTVIGWIVDNWDLVKPIATVVLAIAAAVGVFSAAMAVANAVMLANPIVLIVAAVTVAVAAIVALVITFWDEIKAFFQNIGQGIADVWNKIIGVVKNVIGGIINFYTSMWNGLLDGAKKAWEGVKKVFSAVASFFKSIFSKAWESVVTVFSTGGKIFKGITEGISKAFKTVVNAIIKGINVVVSLPFKKINGTLNLIRNISFLGISPFKGLWKQDPLPVPQIPLLAKGGVIDTATLAVIGEQGKEAVVPLENNTEWIDKLASKVAGMIGGGGDIVLKVGETEIGRVAAKGINNITKSTGNIPLVIA